MSRFLSKAKRIDNGKWVTGYYIKEVYEGLNIETTHLMAYQETFVSRDEKGTYIDTTYADIDIKTLCSCTGIKDKNKKLIFEGDIVRIDLMYFNIKNDEGIVIFKKDYGFRVQYGFNDTFIKTIKAWDEIEVIGNIHNKGE